MVKKVTSKIQELTKDEYANELIALCNNNADVHILHAKNHNLTIIIVYNSNKDIEKVRALEKSFFTQEIQPKLILKSN